MEKVITQINAKTEKGFSPVAYPIGSSAKYIKTKYNLDIEVYYGGSITKENAKNVFDVSDGILLGKSSINIDELKSIINELN